MSQEVLKYGSLDFELKIFFSRSSGPGGQNVNKLNTKAELRFNIEKSTVLSPEQKLIILEKLKSKINNDSELVLFCQTTRSSLKNKELVIIKFYTLLNKALEIKLSRKPTKPGRKAIEVRLKKKKIKSDIKIMRKPPSD